MENKNKKIGGRKNQGLKNRVVIMLTDEDYARLKACCPRYRLGEFVRYCIEYTIDSNKK